MTKQQNKNLILPKSHKHSFYHKALKSSEKQDFTTAAGFEGLDDEINLLRVKIKSLMLNDPTSTKDILRAVGMIARLVEIRHHLSHDPKSGFKEAIRNLMKDVTVPLGISVISKKL